MGIKFAHIELVEAARYDTFFPQLHFYLNPRYSFIRVHIPSVCELELNNVRIQKIKVVGISGTDTTWIGISTKPVMVSGTGTTLPWYRYHLASVRWYWYHPCSGTGTTLRDCPEMADFAILIPTFLP